MATNCTVNKLHLLNVLEQYVLINLVVKCINEYCTANHGLKESESIRSEIIRKVKTIMLVLSTNVLIYVKMTDY